MQFSRAFAASARVTAMCTFVALGGTVLAAPAVDRTVQVTVTDEAGNPLPTAYLTYSLANGDDVKVEADGSGTLFIVADSDKVTVTVRHELYGAHTFETTLPAAHKADAVLELSGSGAWMKFEPASGKQPTPLSTNLAALTAGTHTGGFAGGSDSCAAAVAIAGDGTFAFDNGAATTDGPADPSCDFFGEDNIDNDVWFAWTAGSDGTATVTTCALTTVDTKIAAYDGAGCPGAAPLACNDDDCGFQSSVSFAVTSGNVYTLRIGTFPGEAGGTGSFSVTTIGGGGGGGGSDACSTPEVIAGLGTFAFDNSTATSDGDANPNCDFFGEDTIDNDVWFSWTAPASATYTVDTCGQTVVDTKIGIYTGAACPPGFAANQACNDDFCGFQSSVSWSATGGTTYRIRVGTFPGEAGGTGTFTISEAPPPPTCDSGVGCQLPDQQGHGGSGTLAATSDANPGAGFAVADNLQADGGGSISEICWWGVYLDFSIGADCGPGTGDDFSVTFYNDDNGGNIPGTVKAGPFSVSPTSGPTGNFLVAGALSVAEYQYEATLPSSVSVADGECVWMEIQNNTTGTCFWLWNAAPPGDGRSAQSTGGVYAPTDYDLAWCVDIATTPDGCGAAPPPANDNCADAIAVDCGTTAFDSTNATTDGPVLNPPCDKFGAPGLDNDLWYVFTAPSTGDVVVSTCDLTTVDTKIAIYDGASCAQDLASPLACNDDACGFQSEVLFSATAGNQYLIRLGSFEGAAGGTGSFTIDCDVTIPGNDLCADAVAVGVPSSTAGTTDLATADAAPLCGTVVDTAGVWYSVIGTGTTITASLCDGATAYDAKLSVYCQGCDTLTCVTGIDDFCGLQPQVSWCSQAGAEYLILVHGFSGATGDFNLVLTEDGQSCTAGVVCTAAGACCIGEACLVTTADDCANLGGEYQGDNTSCGTFAYSGTTCTNAFMDISGTGTLAAGAMDDDTGETVPIGFSFSFYGNVKTQVSVCSNGYLTFGTDLGDFTPDPIPSAIDPNDYIAPLWTDLDPGDGTGTVHYQTMGAAPNRVFVAQWTGIPTFPGDVSTNLNTFQALLYETSNAIEYRYADVNLDDDFAVGIENALGDDGFAFADPNGGTAPTDGDCLQITLDLMGSPCAAECLMITGSGDGNTQYDSGNAVYDLQFSEVTGFWPVTMIDVPGFPIPRLRMASQATLLHEWGQPLEPIFKAQVVMFNPVDFPTQPVQHTRGLELFMTPDGHYWTTQYGTAQGNLEWVGTSEFNDMLYLHFNVGF